MSEEVQDAPVVEETEVQAEAATEELENEGQATEEKPSDSSPEKKEPKGVQKRIDELTRNWRETERDRDHWRELAMRTQQQPQKPEPSHQPVQQPVKTLADFEYDESQYQSYIFQQAQEAARRVVQEEYKRTSTVQKQTSFQARESEFSKEVEDYHSVTRNPSLPITQDMVDIIADTDDGPAVLYYLGKNPDITAQLANLSPTAVAREIGRIEAKLATKPEKSVSKAPPPPPKITGVDSTVNVNPATPESDKHFKSAEEWARARNKQLANR